MTARARKVSPPPVTTVLTGPARETSVTSSYRISAPKRSACLRMVSIRSGPSTPSTNPGKFSTSVVFIRAPPAVTEPATTTGASPARFDRSGVSGGAGPDDHQVTYGVGHSRSFGGRIRADGSGPAGYTAAIYAARAGLA